MTKNIPEGDQLFTGLTKIAYDHQANDSNFTSAQTEVEAALATAPNGAIFGSSYHRLPFSFGVSVWNHYQGSESGFGKWMLKSFGKQPVLMSWVNPQLRAQVAQSVLRNHGYFNGRVAYDVVQQKNPKTAKIGYTVTPGRLYRLDSVGYFGLMPSAIVSARCCATMVTTITSPTTPPIWLTLLSSTARPSCASNWLRTCLWLLSISGTSDVSISI